MKLESWQNKIIRCDPYFWRRYRHYNRSERRRATLAEELAPTTRSSTPASVCIDVGLFRSPRRRRRHQEIRGRPKRGDRGVGIERGPSQSSSSSPARTLARPCHCAFETKRSETPSAAADPTPIDNRTRRRETEKCGRSRAFRGCSRCRWPSRTCRRAFELRPLPPSRKVLPFPLVSRRRRCDSLRRALRDLEKAARVEEEGGCCSLPFGMALGSRVQAGRPPRAYRVSLAEDGPEISYSCVSPLRDGHRSEPLEALSADCVASTMDVIVGDDRTASARHRAGKTDVDVDDQGWPMCRHWKSGVEPDAHFLLLW